MKIGNYIFTPKELSHLKDAFISDLEVWKDVKDFEGYYMISNKGRVLSLPKYRGARQGVLSFLKFDLTNKGYYRVRLQKEGMILCVYVHRLVAQAFVDNPKKRPQVNHINSITTDNNSVNLEWTDQSENIKHAYKMGRAKPQKTMLGMMGEKHPNHKKICQLDLSGNLIKIWNGAYEVQRELKIKQQNIGKVCLGKRNKAGGFKWMFFDDYNVKINSNG